MNGYTTISINGSPVGIKFGYLAIKDFSLAAEKKRDVYYDNLNGEQQLSFIGIAKLIQCGYKNNCELKEIEPVLTLEDFNSWVEEGISDTERATQLAEVLRVFAESQYVKALADMPRPEETERTKKKIVKSGSRKLKQVS